MLNLLFITAHVQAREKLRELCREGRCKVTFKSDAAGARALVERGVFDAVVFAVGAASEHAIDEVRSLRGMRDDFPLAVLVDGAPLPWEESALSAGADFIFREPVSAAHLESGLLRCATARMSGSRTTSRTPPAAATVAGRGSLEILRDFSHILGFSLNHKLFAEQFVQRVREIVGVSRIAVYLEHPPTMVGEADGGSRLSCAAAIGIPTDIVECFELSRTAGIGARMIHSPQIISANGESLLFLPPADQKIQREFEILGCQVAVPINDRSRTIGVALLGGHVTGRPFTPDELQLLFLLMEELGSAIKNTWLHQQLSASHQLLADVLAALSSGCLVVDPDLNILHANRSMVAFLKGAIATERLEFADLPPKLAGPLYDCVSKGAKPQPFFFTGGVEPERLFHVAIIPFAPGAAGRPQSAMLVLEDFTQIEAAKRFEIEASKAKLIALIAKRFAHEIRNSLVPLATHEQLLEAEYENDDFRRSLKSALARETGRIQRFTEQMLYLAQPARTAGETVNLKDLIEGCFVRVRNAQIPAGRLQMRSEVDLPLVRCHRPAMEHALQEVLTNALQARPEEPLVVVSIAPDTGSNLCVTIADNGKGFSAETASHAFEPFFTTRNTGVGLGLTVARKIIEDHHGTLTLAPRTADRPHDIELRIPAATSL